MRTIRKRGTRSIRLMHFRYRVLVVWFGVLAGACSLPGPTPIVNPPAQPFVDCLGVPQEICQGAVRDARLNAPPGTVAVRVQVRCTAQVCLPARGQTEVTIQYSDGSTSTMGSAWEQAGPGDQPPPVLPVAPVCVGVPLVRCRETALGAVSAGEDRPAIVSIVVTCTKPPCTEAAGDGDMVVTYADRSTSESGWSYRN